MKHLLLCLILLSTASLAAAQTVTGKVTSEADGTALPGVSVVVKGTGNGTTTDAEGNFNLQVSANNATLVFSFIGFASQEIAVQNRTQIDVAMVADITELNEVVITGFGEQKDISRVAFAVQEVNGNELIRANNANVVNALQGKVAGVQIDQGTGGPMSSSRIRIRGNSSLSNNTQPLIVIDNVLIRPTVTGADSWGAAQDNGNIMKNINPDNIESMTVLKGSAASALYGSDALNGVIIITTKKGIERQGVGVTYNHTTSFEKAYRFIDVQNEFGAGISPDFTTGTDGVQEVDRNNWFYSYGPKLDGRMVRDLDGRMVPWKANDPLSFYETGKFSNNNVVIEGGTDKSSFRASYSNLKNSTIMPSGTEMTRNNFSIRGTQKIGKIIDLDAVVDYTHNFIENPIRQGGNFNPVFRMVYYRPRSLDMDYWMNNYRDPINGGQRTGVNDPYGVGAFLWDTFEDISERTETVFRTNLDLTTHITPWLNFLVRGNVQNELYKGERRRLGSQPKFAGGQFNESTSDSWQYRVQSLLTASKSLTDDLFLSVTLGGETNKLNGGRFYRVFTRNTGGGEDNSLRVPGAFSIANSVNSAGVETRLNPTRLKNAIYLYGDLSYRDMLTFNFSYRTDYSSTLAYADGSGDFSYSYPAVGLAWTFTETFASTPAWLSLGKLRANFGITGGDTDPWIINETGSYTSRGDYFFPGGSLNYSNFRDNTLPNKSLKNREAREWEIGTDLRFFENRLGLDVTYYNKTSRNEIFSLPVAAEAGVSSQIVNGGKIQNKGIELILRATPVKSTDFEWNTIINFTRNRNTVLELPKGVSSQQLSLAFGADVYSMAKPGLDYATIASPYAYATYQKLDGSGNKIDHPSNGERVIGAASGTAGYLTFLRSGAYQNQGAKELGSAMEKFLLSNINSLSYKNFTLNVQVDAKIGGMMASATHQYGSSNGSLKNSLFGRDAAHGGVTYTDENGDVRDDGIIPDGVLADGIKSIVDSDLDLGGMSYADAVAQGHLKPVPAINYYENLTQWSSGIREYSVFENSWVSLREVSVGYTVPASFTQKIKLQNVRFSLVGRNLAYLYTTAAEGINPEGLKSNASGEFSEYGGLPFTRQMGFSVSAGF